jgi:outer membrane lipoprotein-sorting protein
MKKISLFLVLTGQLMTAVAEPEPVELSSPVESWLANQAQLKTWSADLTETRSLKSLTGALKSTGHLWFAAPDRFRWELGKPAETIAVCTGTNLLIIYPRLQRVEEISLTGGQTGEWRSALDMLEAGFPRSEAELLQNYQIVSQSGADETCVLQLQPRSAAVRQMVPRIEIDIDVTNYSLTGTELEFSDGSTLRNNFYNVVQNPRLNKTKFAPVIPTNYTIVQPLGNGR